MKETLVRIAAVGLVACAVAGCGGSGSPDIVGMYQTSEHLVNPGGCTGGAEPVPPVPYFRIAEQELLGATFYVREDCESTDETTCTSGGGVLVDEISDGYEGYITLSSGAPSSCSLSYVTYSAVIDGDVLTFEEFNYTETGAIDPCDTDEAEARGEEMPCVSYEHLVGGAI